MSEYKYDYLLASQFEKTAIWGTLAAGAARAAPMLGRAAAAIGSRAAPLLGRAATYGKNLMGAVKTTGFGGTAANFGKGMFGMQPAQTATAGAKMIHGVGQTAGIAQGAYGVGSAVLGGGDSGQNKTNSLRENTGRYLFKGAEGHSLGQKALHIAPYAAWVGSQLLEDKYPKISKGLNLGAYGLYAGMAGHEAITNPKERLTSGTDALALTAMGIADLARMRRKSQNSPAQGH